MTSRLGLPALVVTLACASPIRSQPARGPDAVPEQLVASEDVAGDFLLRQRVRFGLRDRERSLEVVVQVHCGEVVVVGLTPLGTRLFAIRQRGREVVVEAEPGEGGPLAQERILLDVHRSFLYPLADPPLPDGVHTLSVAERAVEERWRDGRLLERTIHGGSGDGRPSAVVRYEGGMAAGRPPRRVVLEDLRRGYELEIETLARRELACSGRPGPARLVAIGGVPW